jgi:ABC-type glutathione transport system ATPase component
MRVCDVRNRVSVKEPDDVAQERRRTERFATHDRAEAYVSSASAAAADDEGAGRRPVPAVRMYNLRKVYNAGAHGGVCSDASGDELVAVNSLSLSLHRGECFGFLGPNGAVRARVCACVRLLTTCARACVCIFIGQDYCDQDAVWLRTANCGRCVHRWQVCTLTRRLCEYVCDRMRTARVTTTTLTRT